MRAHVIHPLDDGTGGREDLDGVLVPGPPVSAARPRPRQPGTWSAVQTLRALERDGLVRRTVYPAVPVRVEYALTPLGQTLREPLRTLTEWSVRHIDDVLAAREEYDAHAEHVS